MNALQELDDDLGVVVEHFRRRFAAPRQPACARLGTRPAYLLGGASPKQMPMLRPALTISLSGCTTRS